MDAHQRHSDWPWIPGSPFRTRPAPDEAGSWHGSSRGQLSDRHRDDAHRKRATRNPRPIAVTRTSVTAIGLGFLVARFGLVLHLMKPGAGTDHHVASSVIGIVMTLIGR